MSGYIDLSPARNRFMIIDLGDGPEMIMLEAAGVALGLLEPDQAQEHDDAIENCPDLFARPGELCVHGLPPRLCMQCPESGLTAWMRPS